jgi:hypothetical protein
MVLAEPLTPLDPPCRCGEGARRSALGRDFRSLLFVGTVDHPLDHALGVRRCRVEPVSVHGPRRGRRAQDVHDEQIEGDGGQPAGHGHERQRPECTALGSAKCAPSQREASGHLVELTQVQLSQILERSDVPSTPTVMVQDPVSTVITGRTRNTRHSP